jgi:outer membrane assembly lipoprotein YfgL
MNGKPSARTRRAIGCAAAALFAGALNGCASLQSWIPSIPPPSFDWLTSMFGGGKKIAPLPEFPITANAQIAWQVTVGAAAPGLAPAVTPNAIYAANNGGTIYRVDPTNGAIVWRVEAGRKLAAGVGADATLLAVGTDKGDVFAFDPDGKSLWQVKVTSEVLGPPQVADGIVVVFTGDGRIHGLAAADGRTKWVYQRTNPPLTIRNYAGGAISRGGLFAGTAGGKLLAIDLATGNVGWEGNVATPKGATELERIADVTSLPVVEERQVCTVAFQGRIACFDLVRGELVWTRDVSSLSGIAIDNRFQLGARINEQVEHVATVAVGPFRAVHDRPSLDCHAAHRSPAISSWSSIRRATSISSTAATASWSAARRATARRPRRSPRSRAPMRCGRRKAEFSMPSRDGERRRRSPRRSCFRSSSSSVGRMSASRRCSTD